MKFFNSNDTLWRVLRTIVQAIIGVIVANVDVIIGAFNIGAIWKPIIVALVMAILSPIMAEIGKAQERKAEWLDKVVEEGQDAPKGE